MLQRLDAAVGAALQPLQAATEAQAAEEVLRPLAQVSLSSPEGKVQASPRAAASLLSGAAGEVQRPAGGLAGQPVWESGDGELHLLQPAQVLGGGVPQGHGGPERESGWGWRACCSPGSLIFCWEFRFSLQTS